MHDGSPKAPFYTDVVMIKVHVAADGAKTFQVYERARVR